MAGVLRTWACLNGRCGEAFDSWVDNPECPRCGCIRVGWVPRGGHVGKSAGGIDCEFRTLADNFGLTDLHSARRGEAAKVISTQPAVDPRSAPAVQFAPGFACVPHSDRAVCVPSVQNVNFKTKAQVGGALAHSRTVPGVHTNTRVEARHSGKP